MTCTRVGASVLPHTQSFSSRGDTTRLLQTQLRPALLTGPRSNMGLGMGSTERQEAHEPGIQALYCQRLPSEFTCLIASKGEYPETCSANALRPQRPILCPAYVCSSEALMIKTEDTHPEV